MDYNNDTALVVLERAAKLSGSKSDLYGKGKVLSLLVFVYADKAAFPISKTYYDRAAIHFTALGNYSSCEGVQQHRQPLLFPGSI